MDLLPESFMSRSRGASSVFGALALLFGVTAALLLIASPALAQAGGAGHAGHAVTDASDHAAHGGYADLIDREIKALSEEEIAALLAGEGMGFALAAELNGVPGPLHLLELREALELSVAQVQGITTLFDRMRAETGALGAQVVELERTLDRRFAHRHVDADVVRELTAEIARLRGEIRAVHLVTHLEVDPLLTDTQREAYARLRGYAPPG
jgi:hypothetical protein